MIQYRPFRNPDLPGLVEVWNESWTGRGAVRFPCRTPFEEHVLAKPYFDPAGIVVAEEAGYVVGYAHAGFGPNANDSGLSYDDGVVCMVVVRPASRRRGVGAELLKQCLEYLRGRGAKNLTAGSVRGNPFYMAVYGGSACTGFLASDEAARPFLTSHGFRPDASFDVYHRRLSSSPGVADGRFAELRRRYELRVESRSGVRSWWDESVLGPIELHDFLLEEKTTGRRVARASVWEMGGFGYRWNESVVGLVEVEVLPELRRGGLARFLLAQTFRYLQDQYFTLVEAQLPHEDAVASALFRGVGFQAVDSSHVYRLSV